MKILDLLEELPPTIEYHDELNPAIWDGEIMKDEIRQILLKIADSFIQSLEMPSFKAVDIILTGSSANYNYTPTSDIDLHIVADFKKIQPDCDITEEFFDAKKSLWNNKHNVTINGQKVELYVQDISHKLASAGIYSVTNNKWIQQPSYEPFDFDDAEVIAKLDPLLDEIRELLHDPLSTEEDYDAMITKIYDLRQTGLTKNGEKSLENILFKVLRNYDIVSGLKDRLIQIQDKNLSK